MPCCAKCQRPRGNPNDSWLVCHSPSGAVPPALRRCPAPPRGAQHLVWSRCPWLGRCKMCSPRLAPCPPIQRLPRMCSQLSSHLPCTSSLALLPPGIHVPLSQISPAWFSAWERGCPLFYWTKMTLALCIFSEQKSRILYTLPPTRTSQYPPSLERLWNTDQLGFPRHPFPCCPTRVIRSVLSKTGPDHSAWRWHVTKLKT